MTTSKPSLQGKVPLWAQKQYDNIKRILLNNHENHQVFQKYEILRGICDVYICIVQLC